MLPLLMLYTAPALLGVATIAAAIYGRTITVQEKP